MRLRAEQRAFWENLQAAQLDLSDRRLQLAHLKFATERSEPTAAPKQPKKKAQPKPLKTEQKTTEQKTTEQTEQMQTTTKRQKREEKAPEHQQPEQPIPAQKPQTAYRSLGSGQTPLAVPNLRTCTSDEFLAFVSNFQEQCIANREKLSSQAETDGSLSAASQAERKLAASQSGAQLTAATPANYQ
jgi:hypothetical protein